MPDLPLTVIFDLDGTLVDTAGDLVATLNLMLRDEDCMPLSLEIARPMIGHGARALLEKGLQINHKPYDDTKLALLTERFIQHYSEHIADHSRIRPDLLETLQDLRDKGWRLGICTNKRTPLAKQLVTAMKLSPYFHAVIGSGELAFSKPDPRMLKVAINECSGVVEQSVMVGDSKTDIETARALGVPVIAVDFGYTSIPPHELGADIVISEWKQLTPALQNLKFN